MSINELVEKKFTARNWEKNSSKSFRFIADWLELKARKLHQNLFDSKNDREGSTNVLGL